EYPGQAEVGDGRIAVFVDADVVTLDHVGGRIRAGDENAAEVEIAGGVVAADDVPRRGRAAADGVAGRAVFDLHAVRAVAQSDGAGVVSADVVAEDGIPRRADVSDVNAVARVAGDDVAGRRRRAADGVVRGAAGDDYTVSPAETRRA